jgi:hypothetical protein
VFAGDASVRSATANGVHPAIITSVFVRTSSVYYLASTILYVAQWPILQRGGPQEPLMSRCPSPKLSKLLILLFMLVFLASGNICIMLKAVPWLCC